MSAIPRSAEHAAPARRLVAFAGNPNVGKTTLFNRLTGHRAKVANYPGVTVETRSGSLVLGAGSAVDLVDVPGTYSLDPKSLDEEVAYRVLIGAGSHDRRPDAIVCVIDAGNLERNLYLVSQVIDLGVPTIVVCNMMDTASTGGLEIDVDALSRELGVPVVPTVAAVGKGVDRLVEMLRGELPEPPERRWQLPPEVQDGVEVLAARLRDDLPDLTDRQRFSDALRALVNESSRFLETHHGSDFWRDVLEQRRRLDEGGVPYRQAEIIGRYGWITPLVARVAKRTLVDVRTLSDKIDAVVTHRVAGPILFFGVLALVFQSIFAWAVPFMDVIDGGMAELGSRVGAVLPPGPVQSLIVDGVIAGVGAVVIFLPQILILFFFLGILEDTGYMARAAFLMDRIMSRVGLSGRSVVPLLSGFACAIPAVMAARTIDNERDRLVTILVTPLMTCSARLPVYTLLIGAFIPAGTVLGVFGTQGLTLLTLYLLGISLAVIAAWVLKRFVVRGDRSVFVMELPPYRMPRLGDVAWRMVERAKLFLKRAGTIIFAVSIVLWFLAYYPRPTFGPEIAALPEAERAETMTRDALSQSAMGHLGRLIEPVIEPLGYDWKIGIALIASFAAREVAVSALGTIYGVGDADETSHRLVDRMRADVDPDTGRPVFTPLVAVSLLVFYVIALQCMSTVAIVRRETGGWRWPAFQLAYLTALAWIAAFATFQGGRLLGFT